jgi:hypothetical protein
MVKVPAGCPLAQYLWEECDRIDPSQLTWGVCGPQLMLQAVEKFSLQNYVQPPEVFCPIPFIEWRRIIEPGVPWTFGEQTRSVHLWNEMWRRAQIDKDGCFEATSLYEVLKRRFLA